MDAKSPIILLTDKVLTWYEVVIKSVPNILVSIVVLFCFLFASKMLKKFSYKPFLKLTKNQVLSNLFSSVLSVSVFIIGFFIALEILNLEKTVASILAGAGVLGLALGFAFQEIAANFVAGVLIAFRKPYSIGDTIKIEGFFGQVTEINLRVTKIIDIEGLDVIIPNKDMFTKPFINFTTVPKRKLILDVGVSYSDDLDKVEEVTREALKTTKNIIGNEVEVYFKEFGDSSINLNARFWINYPNNTSYLEAKHDAVKKLKKAYDANGISIPFPIRTLDFNKGAVELLKNRQV
jgi:small conductance mechanosensitive channel